MAASFCVNASMFNDEYRTAVVFPANYQVGDNIINLNINHPEYENEEE